jgi:acetyl esterase/lipase
MLDMLSDYYGKPFDKPIVGVPNFPETVVDEFLSTQSGKPAVTESDPPSRLEFALAAVQTGRYQKILGNSPELFPLERIRKMGLPLNVRGPGSAFPPTFILHGQQDSAVPVSGTQKFVTLLKEADPTVRLHIAIRPGDHGFDAFATLEEHWLKQGLDFIAQAWRGPTSTPLDSLL